MRNRDRLIGLIGLGEPVLPRYERIAFEKTLIAPQGQPLAAFVCPGHPLLDAVIDLTLERNRDLLKRGTVLVDERDFGTEPRVMFYLEHAIQDARLNRNGSRRVVSKRLMYVEMATKGNVRHVHYAPYLDFLPSAADEPGIGTLFARPECQWIPPADWNRKLKAMPSPTSCPSILNEARRRPDLLQGRLQKYLEDLRMEARFRHCRR